MVKLNDFPWLPVVHEVWGDDQFQEHVVELLRSGKMTPEDQRWLAKCFEPNGRTRFSLEFTIRPGKHKSDKRHRGFLERVEEFERIRDAVWDEFREVILHEGDKGREQADTEAVKRATRMIKSPRPRKVSYAGATDYITEKTAYELLTAAKARKAAHSET